MTDNERMDLESIGRLLRLAEGLGLAELDVTQAGQRVTLRFGAPQPAHHGAIAPAPQAADASGDSPPPHWMAVHAPMVGVFYRAPGPGAAPFVEPGDRVETGQTVGMIEAMKVFSEIPCDFAGIVERIVAENGTLVRPDDVLFYISSDA